MSLSVSVPGLTPMPVGDPFPANGAIDRNPGPRGRRQRARGEGARGGTVRPCFRDGLRVDARIWSRVGPSVSATRGGLAARASAADKCESGRMEIRQGK